MLKFSTVMKSNHGINGYKLASQHRRRILVSLKMRLLLYSE